MHRNLTISNLLSASRIFLVIPMGYCLVWEFPYHRLWTAGIIAIAVATDLLDGFLARKLHQVTDLGKVLDPLADKIGIGLYAVLIAWTGDVPVWFVIFILLRDLLIFSGGIYIPNRQRKPFFNPYHPPTGFFGERPQASTVPSAAGFCSSALPSGIQSPCALSMACRSSMQRR